MKNTETPVGLGVLSLGWVHTRALIRGGEGQRQGDRERLGEIGRDREIETEREIQGETER